MGDGMKRMQGRIGLLAAALATAWLPMVAAAQTVERQADGLIVHPSDTGAADVRLQVVNDHIVRVSADMDGDFQRSASLMRVPINASPTFSVSEGKEQGAPAGGRDRGRGIAA